MSREIARWWVGKLNIFCVSFSCLYVPCLWIVCIERYGFYNVMKDKVLCWCYFLFEIFDTCHIGTSRTSVITRVCFCTGCFPVLEQRTCICACMCPAAHCRSKFTCGRNSRQCYSFMHRCDGVNHCARRTDELHCCKLFSAFFHLCTLYLEVACVGVVLPRNCIMCFYCSACIHLT